MEKPNLESNIEKREEELLNELNECDDWRDRYDHIIQTGKSLTPLPTESKTDENKISGCVSQLWLEVKLEDGKLQMRAESDSHFVRGLVAFILKIYSDSTPKEILNAQHTFLEKSGIIRNLSPNRANGAAQLLKKILEYAHFYNKN